MPEHLPEVHGDGHGHRHVARSGLLDQQCEGDTGVGLHPQADLVDLQRAVLSGEQRPGRWPQDGDHVEQRRRQGLARADVHRHARPAPVVDVQGERDVGLGRGPRRDARGREVAVVAAAHHLGRVDRAHRPQQPVLGVALVVGGGRQGRVHQQVGEHLQQVVLHDVADRPDGVVERTPVGDVEVLGHRDLEVVDPLPVPQRLEQGVGEPQHQQVLDRLLAQEVVDPEHPVLGVVAAQPGVEGAGRRQVAAERLLDHQPRALRQADGGDPVGDRAEQRRRDGEVVHRERLGAGLRGDGLGEAGEHSRVRVVAR